MAAAAAATVWLSPSRAAATETRVRACGKKRTKLEKIDDQHSPCSMRVHGLLIITRESRKIGETRSRSEHDEVPPYCTQYDHRTEVQDRSLFRSHPSCRDLIHRMLAEGPKTGNCDLAADNWGDFQPRDIATTIVAGVLRDTPYAVDIEMDLHVRLIYSEPKALRLLLACEDAAAARVPRKRRREPAGDLCAVCLSDFLETDEEEETVTLPCSHTFHRRCIEPWFHRASTCPTCRRDASNGTIRRDANGDQVDFLETREGNDDDGSPVQDDRPVRARRQPNASGGPSLD